MSIWIYLRLDVQHTADRQDGANARRHWRRGTGATRSRRGAAGERAWRGPTICAVAGTAVALTPFPIISPIFSLHAVIRVPFEASGA